MAEHSAGILLYRGGGDRLRVLLVHPGGPYWAKKDEGAWSLPKGIIEPGEDPFGAACREFAEETGQPPPTGTPIDLGRVRLRSGKYVDGFAVEGDFDPKTLRSNTFTMIWPPRSGIAATFLEVDRADWFDVEIAIRKANPAQAELITRLREILDPDR
ncbi:NUDIX domain-containing protein [Gordonia alkaliphila]|uniref:NUDIX domain-containing protein n=1 Tax=Gordonia alkaliphila TaxID=1053547 RepID=A0ABP8ZD84_9ACTN